MVEKVIAADLFFRQVCPLFLDMFILFVNRQSIYGWNAMVYGVWVLLLSPVNYAKKNNLHLILNNLNLLARSPTGSRVRAPHMRLKAEMVIIGFCTSARKLLKVC